MPKYRFHILPEDGAGDIELRFADDFSAMQTAEVVIRDQMRGRRCRSGLNLTKVIEVLRSDGTTAGIADASSWSAKSSTPKLPSKP